MPNTWACTCIATAIGLGVVTAGCARGHRWNSDGPASTAAPSNLIFNAAPDPSAAPVIARSNWPEAFAADRGREHTVYTETIRDRQGTHFRDQDHFRRYFISTSTGTLKR